MTEITTFRSGDNFIYLISQGEEAAIVDPGIDPTDVLSKIAERELKVKLVIVTHHHSDHTASIRRVSNITGAQVASSSYCSQRIGGSDLILDDGDRLSVGISDIRIIHTPGHTPGGICLLVDDEYLITGDTLFIGDCGRCDLPGSSMEDMFASLRRLKELPDELIVLPGHDYGPKAVDTLGNQKRTNPTLLAKNIKEFSGI
jgi:glyoxylase-like metal-dependent hydrolase (beta-lactamase superfamily II)